MIYLLLLSAIAMAASLASHEFWVCAKNKEILGCAFFGGMASVMFFLVFQFGGLKP